MKKGVKSKMLGDMACRQDQHEGASGFGLARGQAIAKRRFFTAEVPLQRALRKGRRGTCVRGHICREYGEMMWFFSG